jgi:TolB-like protein/Tfp pilus assembly protein PilF
VTQARPVHPTQFRNGPIQPTASIYAKLPPTEVMRRPPTARWGMIPPVTEPSHAVFLSYASQDAEAAQRICEALRAAGIEVWFDQSALRGGDVWDQTIRKQIKTCVLFIPVISRHTHERDEGYFRLEWKLAVDRSHLMTTNKAFLLPVVVDDTRDDEENVPDRFRDIHWTRLPGGETPPAFVERVRRLVSPEPSHGPTAQVLPAGTVPTVTPPIRVRVSALRGSTRALLAVVAVLVFGALLYSGRYKFWMSKHPTLPAAPSVASATFSAPPHSIAVLPFADMSEKRDQEYFADGLTEEILNLLSSIPALKVIGRTSSFQFKGRNDDLRSIGEKLGAAYILEGSVRHVAERVRVTAQLISARDGVHLWSNTYDRPFGDVLELQDELAVGVARALEVSVRNDAPQARGSRNIEAYDFYLRGLHSLEGFNGERFETAANYFQQALDLDPNFGQAAAQLGRMYVLEAEFGYAPAAPTYERARRTLETAVRLDPTSGVAHAWLGWMHMAYDWDWATANADMQEALRLAPRDPEVSLCAARLAMALGHWEDAIRLLTAASTRDPLVAGFYNSLSEIYLRTDRLADADAAERRVLEISPTYVSAPYNLAKVLLAEGRPEDALALIKSRQQDISDRPASLALIYHTLGRKVDSDTQLAVLIRRYQNDEALEIADVLAFRGEADEAFRWIDRAYGQHDAGLYLIKVDPLLRKIEADPRYKAFLRKMNLPE